MAEDRFTLAGHDPDHSVLVGWDAKRATFYAHVWAGESLSPPIWSCGTSPREVASVSLLTNVLAPWAELTEEARDVLDGAHTRWSRHQTAAHREARLVAIRAVLPPPFFLRGEPAGVATTIDRVDTKTIEGSDHAGWQQATAVIRFDGPDRTMTATHSIALDSERHDAVIQRLDGVNVGIGRLLVLQSTGVLRDAGVRTITGHATIDSPWGQVLDQGWSGPPAQNLEVLRRAVERGTAELHQHGHPKVARAFLAALTAEVGAKADTLVWRPDGLHYPHGRRYAENHLWRQAILRSSPSRLAELPGGRVVLQTGQLRFEGKRTITELERRLAPHQPEPPLPQR